MYDFLPKMCMPRLHAFYYRVMKIVIFFLTVFLIQVSASTNGQTVTLRGQSATLREVIRSIQNQTDFNIVYNKESVNLEGVFQIERSQTSLNELLTAMSKTFSLAYVIKGKDIILRENPRPFISENSEIQTSFTIKGWILDSLDKPVAGASIKLKGTNRGTQSNQVGFFQLENVNRGDILQVSHIGFQRREVAISDETIRIVIKAQDDIDEVVITGYQVIDKRKSTSAVASLKVAEIPQIGSASVEGMLQGQLPGVSVVTSSANPGTAPKIRIRGLTTITGNSDPIWVLDGVILENSVAISVADLNNPDVMNSFNSVIGGISPHDIESITVLKDASATAIYGTRAANGVIVLTTKRGTNMPNKLGYSHASSLAMRPSYDNFNLMNSAERVRLTQQISDDGMSVNGVVGMENLIQQYAVGNLTLEEYKSEVKKLEMRNTDWFDVLFRNAYSQNHNLSTSGGTDKLDYYTSFNYNSEEASDKFTNFKSYSGFTKVNLELLKGVDVETTLQIGRRDRENTFRSVNPFLYAMRTSRTIPVYDEFGDYFYYRNTTSGYFKYNILNELNTTNRSSTLTDIRANAQLNVDVWKGLEFKSLYSYSSANSTAIEYAKEQSGYIANIRKYNFGEGTPSEIAESLLPYGGVYNETNYLQRSILFRNSLEYRISFGNRLNMDAMLGQEFRTTDYRGTTIDAYGYMHDRGNTFYNPPLVDLTGFLPRNTIARNIPKRSYISYYGVYSAMLDNKYVINANVRFDGSNLFGSNPKYRYLPLWSVSGKWIISNEDFLKDSKVLSNLALRASYGLRGNIVEDSSPQIIASALPPNPSTGLLEMEIIQAPNPDLKWETTSSTNIGLEFGFFNNRLNAVVDYYRDFSKDLIAYKAISSVSGFQSKYVNYADVRNEGLDVGVTGRILDTDNFQWIANVNLGFVRNKVVRASITPQAASLVRSTYTPGEVFEGKPVNSMFSYRFARLDNTGMPLFYDQNNEEIGATHPEISQRILTNIHNLAYEAPRDPIINGGINNTFRYKDFSLSVLMAFGLKNVVRLPELAYISQPTADQNANRSILDRWRKAGDEEITTIPGLATGSNYFSSNGQAFYTTSLYNQSQESIVSGDYLRLRNVLIEYRVPKNVLKHVGIRGKSLQDVALKIQGQNLYTWKSKRLKGFDPETINYTTNGYGALPLMPTFTFGLNVNL
ncbi:SusC/RagA family TonB-linked outer membrane protein [Sphingobacterium hotanense]|uniref:SusC/RagA family TonB-linked outer membrane protein n=1 Tax=Sphingobacterium hotanense TaxID=649196 RepID=UPI0021A7F8BB|nr:SusC/RagA family TonB-linked outer membrane protein [Sphingobacterium hotanense]MCT1525098.1 SusC/RagA family TonB-linked outer membrane protein [Sphingobacterium hotanense]